jgi:O-antigen/teichoic acid export membrane protein
MLLMMGVSLYASRLVLEALGIDDFGLYNVVGGIVALFSIINGALSAGSSRFLTFELGRRDFSALKKTFSASFTIHSFIALIVFIFAETAGLWYINNYLVIPDGRLGAANWIYQFSIVSCMLSLTQVPYSALIIAHEKMKIYAWTGVAEALYQLLLVYLLLYVNFTDKLIFYGLLICLWSIALQLYYRFYCTRNFAESKLTIVKDRHIYKNMLSFSLWDVMGNFCVTGNSQGINVLMNYFFGIAVNAAHGVTFQVEKGLTVFSNNFMTAVKPQIVKLYAEGSIGKMMSLVFESSKYSYFLLYVVALPVFLEVDYILKIWLKEVPEYTALFIRCIIVIRLIRAFATPVVQAVHATGNIKWLNLYSGGASIALTLPLTYFFYKSGYPAETSFYVSGVVSILCNYLELFIMKKEISFSILSYSLRVYGISLLIALLSIAPAYCMFQSMDTSFFRLLITSITSLITIGVLVFFIGINKINKRRIKIIIYERIIYWRYRAVKSGCSKKSIRERF